MTHRTHLPTGVRDAPGSTVVHTHTDHRRWAFHVVDGGIERVDWERFDGEDRGTKRPPTVSQVTRERVLWAADNPEFVVLARYIRETTAARGVDKLLTDHHGLSTGEWATLTGRHQSTVARNARRGANDGAGASPRR